jgi:hypothetical protein
MIGIVWSGQQRDNPLRCRWCDDDTAKPHRAVLTGQAT